MYSKIEDHPEPQAFQSHSHEASISRRQIARSNSQLIGVSPKGASVPNVIFNTFKSFVGSGILGLPYGFLKGGWALSLISFPITCLIAGYAMVDLIHCKDVLPRGKADTFPDIGRVAFGPFGYWLVQVSLLAYQIGCCMSYYLFITQNLEILVPSMSQQIWVIIFLSVFTMMSFIRSLKTTGILSMMANVCVLGGIVLLLIGVLLTGKKPQPIIPFSWSSFPVFFGIVLFAFEGIGLVIPIHNSMEKKKYYVPALVTTLAFVCILYSGFGFTCYLFLGAGTPEMITAAIAPQYSWIRITTQALLIFAITISYHLLAHPVYEAFDELPCIRKSNTSQTRHWLWSTLIRFCLIAVSAIPSVTPLRKHFPDLIGIVGGTFGAALAFIIPGLLHLKICWRECGVLRKILDILLLSFAIPASIVVTIFTVISLINNIKKAH